MKRFLIGLWFLALIGLNVGLWGIPLIKANLGSTKQVAPAQQAVKTSAPVAAAAPAAKAAPDKTPAKTAVATSAPAASSAPKNTPAKAKTTTPKTVATTKPATQSPAPKPAAKPSQPAVHGWVELSPGSIKNMDTGVEMDNVPYQKDPVTGVITPDLTPTQEGGNYGEGGAAYDPSSTHVYYSSPQKPSLSSFAH